MCFHLDEDDILSLPNGERRHDASYISVIRRA
jgi:hypothetical protein